MTEPPTEERWVQAIAERQRRREQDSQIRAAMKAARNRAKAIHHAHRLRRRRDR